MEKKRAKVGKTIRSSLQLAANSGSGKYLAFTSIWLIIGAFTSLTAIFQKHFVNAAAEIIGGNGEAFRIATLWLATWATIAILSAFMDIFTAKAQRRLWEKVAYYVQNEIMKKVSKIRLAYFDNTETLRILDFVKSGIDRRASNIVSGTFQILYGAVQFITIGFIIAGENLWIALIIIAASIPSVMIRYQQTEESYRDELKNSHEARFQAYVSWLLTRKKYIKEMQFYDLYDYIFKRFDSSVEALQGVRTKTMKKYTGWNAVGMLLNYIAIGISLVLIVLDIYNGKRSIGSFVLVYSSAQNLQNAVAQIFTNLLMIGNEGRYIEDYFQVMDFEEENYELQSAKKDVDLTITFKNVSFSYPQTDRVVLKNINLEIKQGEKIAIIGENGSGKSTFIALLTGLYQPVEGQILVNGIDISKNLGSLRNHLSCTYQNFVHYELTIKENILLGDFANAHTKEDVERAAKKAGIYEDIMAMPDGFDTPLGNYAENGRDLSGGQWQKLAMAKNLMKESAKIMILDEPTAALDPVAESDLYREFQKLAGDKTVLLISHRLGATRLAERILVFQEGSIVEDGSHEALMKKNGRYTEIYHAQSQWYV